MGIQSTLFLYSQHGGGRKFSRTSEWFDQLSPDHVGGLRKGLPKRWTDFYPYFYLDTNLYLDQFLYINEHGHLQPNFYADLHNHQYPNINGYLDTNFNLYEDIVIDFDLYQHGHFHPYVVTYVERDEFDDAYGYFDPDTDLHGDSIPNPYLYQRRYVD